jgi:hypothetical protein
MEDKTVEWSSNRTSRRDAPFWTRHGDSTPAEAKEIRDQIESNAQASEYRELNLRALRGRHDSLVKAISRCTVDAPCAEILCSRCARRYRLWLASELTHLAAYRVPALVATVLLEAAQGPALSKIEPRLLHKRLRKRLTRAGIEAAIGGTEASYDAKTDRWTVHVHLLVFDSHDTGRVRLRGAFGGSSLDRPVLCQPLRDPVAQVAYLQKFQTCHRPGKPGYSGRGRSYPMKPEQIGQLAQWTKGRRFEDFLFILGLRRRGSRFEPERGFEEALLEHRRNARVPDACGDGGDGGDGPRSNLVKRIKAARPPTSSLTPSHNNSGQLYRDPDSKRAFREDKNRTEPAATLKHRSGAVATNTRR